MAFLLSPSYWGTQMGVICLSQQSSLEQILSCGFVSLPFQDMMLILCLYILLILIYFCYYNIPQSL